MSRKCAQYRDSDIDSSRCEASKYKKYLHLWERQKKSHRMGDGKCITEIESAGCRQDRPSLSHNIKLSQSSHLPKKVESSGGVDGQVVDALRNRISNGNPQLPMPTESSNIREVKRSVASESSGYFVLHHSEKQPSVFTFSASDISKPVKEFKHSKTGQTVKCAPSSKSSIAGNSTCHDSSNRLKDTDVKEIAGYGSPLDKSEIKCDTCMQCQKEMIGCPSGTEEYLQISCPAFYSSACSSIVPSSLPSPVLDSHIVYSPSTLFHVPPITPATPSSGIASQVSLDSGILSAQSSDVLQNDGCDLRAKMRRQTASSVSSGTSEMWHSPLDGEGSALVAVNEDLGTEAKVLENVFFSGMKKSAGYDCLSKCLKISSHYGNESELHAQTSAHSGMDQVDLIPLQQTEIYMSSMKNHTVNDRPCAAIENCQKLESENLFANDISGEKYLNAIMREGLLVTQYTPVALKKLEKYAANLVMLAISEALSQNVLLGWSIKCSGQCNQELCREDYKKYSSSREFKERDVQLEVKSKLPSIGLSSCSSSLCWTPEIPFTPTHRPQSRVSKHSSLSFSHDSLVSGGGPFQDDSYLITGAVSHDALIFRTARSPKVKKRSCMACLDNDIYSLPVDTVRPYQGPILQPKVIVHQPKRKQPGHSSKVSHSVSEEIDHLASRGSSSNNKLRRINKSVSQRLNNDQRIQSELNFGDKRCVEVGGTTSNNINNNESGSNIDEKFSSESSLLEKGDETHRTKARIKNDNRTCESTKLCKLMPFTSSKSHRRKDSSDVKVDRKKGRSLSSNIRNTLVTFFSFRRGHKDMGHSVNAKNEFIDASSQGFYESSEGHKWGKICPLPSAPPLRTSIRNSAFTDHVGTVTLSSRKPSQSSSKQNIGGIVDSKANCNGTITTNCQRQSNSISPASLLSCLGHPRTNSIDDNEPRHRSTYEASLKSFPANSNSNRTAGNVTSRALPPLPSTVKGQENKNGVSEPENWNSVESEKLDEGCDFASIIEKVKDYGWYWGPISGEAAEKVLSNEPDGSFIVRDSSDDHYIFSLTFRLNGVTHHVRIEHDQGNFSFGGFTRFKSQTIVDFIEKAVEHSRSGRYLFFHHRRPVLGPMRVQLLYPVSRFKHVQSLQHLCRFIIVKHVRKDLIHDLPLPQRLKDYLSSPHYYSEQVELCMSSSNALHAEGETVESKQSPSYSRQSAHMPHTRLQDILAHQQIPGISDSTAVHDSTDDLFLSRQFHFQFNSSPSTFRKQQSSSEFRLSSSHSSLDINALQASASGGAYPISPSMFSSGSMSGKFPNIKCFSLNRRSNFLSSSSHSSPSSPVPFDFSPFSPLDWLSSSDDNLQLPKASLKSRRHITSPISGPTEPRLSSDNCYQPSVEGGKKNILCDYMTSASHLSKSVVSAFALQTNSTVICDTETLLHRQNGDVDSEVQITVDE